MKRKYLTPETLPIICQGEYIMGASRESGPGRYVSGGPTSDTDSPLPEVAGDYTGDEDDDPLNSGHGQGTGGGGNRGKEFDLWGFDSFDLWN